MVLGSTVCARNTSVRKTRLLCFEIIKLIYMDSKMLFFSNSISNPSTDYSQSFCCCSLSLVASLEVCVYIRVCLYTETGKLPIWNIDKLI